MVAGDDTDERRTVAGQRLHVERTVREHRTATVEGFVFRSVRVHVHYDTGIAVSYTHLDVYKRQVCISQVSGAAIFQIS